MHIAASLVLLALIGLAYRRLFRHSRNRGLFLLRVAQVAVLLLILGGQVLRVSWSRSSNRVVILRDRSASIAAAGAESVAAEVVPLLSSLGHFSFEVWEFGGAARRLSTADYSIDTGRTRIGLALGAVAKTRPGAIVLLTDGQDNGEDDPVAVARDAGVRVYTVGLGGRSRNNIRLVSMEFPPVVSVGETVTVRVRLLSSSIASARVRVRLNEQAVVVEGDSGTAEQEVEFRLHSDSAGIQELEASVESLPDEASYSDNRLVMHLEVRPAKMRVCYLTNRPGLNTRFLLSVLRADSSVELLQLTPAKVTSGTRDLKNADVYILDACAENGEMRGLLGLVQGRVQQGAGALIAAGPGFEPGEVLGRMLLLDGEVDDDSGTFSPVATSAGRLLPWFDAATGIDLSTVSPFRRIWSGDFEPEGQEVWLESAEDGVPLLFCRRHGRGRVLYLAGYPLWRWGYGPELRYDERSPLRRLVSGIVQSLGYADTARFRAGTSRRVYLAGEPVSVFLTARAADGSGWEGLVPYLTTDSGGSKVPMTELGKGQYEAVIQCGPGLRTARVTVTADDTVLGVASTQFTVAEQTLERSLTGLNAELLRRIAAASGGQFVTAESLGVVGLDIRPASFRRTLLWDTRRAVWGYLAFVLLAAVELVLRRTRGLL